MGKHDRRPDAVQQRGASGPDQLLTEAGILDRRHLGRIEVVEDWVANSATSRPLVVKPGLRPQPVRLGSGEAFLDLLC